MRKKISAKLLCCILLGTFLVGCGNTEIKTDENSKTPSSESTGMNTTEKDYPSDGRLVLLKDIQKECELEKVENIYCNTTEEGQLKLYQDITDGTPYAFYGIVFDEDYLSCTAEFKKLEAEDASVGSGVATGSYKFNGKKAGQTDVIILTEYLEEEDCIEGVLYHVAIEEDLKCHLEWYCYVTKDEEFQLIQE